ncbi:MAG: UvrD-helicase domain-containing protein [Gammaproteobacteria bacterium]
MASLDTSTHPEQNANVFASAGSGKTWLLITRICRLLLAGAEPHHILAITFTRKSAAEMRARLFDKLEAWSVMDDAALKIELSAIKETTDSSTLEKARALYEKLLFSNQTIRISTFHAFCEEIIRAFPLESELPTTFELTEHSHIYTNQAWQRLLTASEQSGKAKLREALHSLFDFCFGLNGTKTALLSFLNARSDWRAFTKHATDAATFAHEELIKKVGDAQKEDIQSWLENKEFLSTLKNYYDILRLSPTKTYQDRANRIEPLLALEHYSKTEFSILQSIFLTNDNKPRKLTISKAWEKALTSEQSASITQIHENFTAEILHLLDSQIHAQLLNANQAWFSAGRELLQQYQHVKFEHGVIDFNDLEWETYRLLQQEDHALWVQFKLGQRIRHFLVDEFQDTNPIQWHLLKPLIESSQDQHQSQSSSLFLVGDIKQSIYRFRGANPEIQTLASKWSQKHLNSNLLSNDHSWRSSPAIINYVNLIFSHPSISEQFCAFQPHTYQHQDHWGFVKIHPLIEIEDKQDQHDFRDPLLSSRENSEETAHYQEGVLLAKEITSLIENKTPIYDDEQIRPAKFSDILILTRTRSHLDELKAGLISASIPIHANDATRLLDYLEIKDLLALLNTLVDPYNDLPFIHLLSSPIFNIDEPKLIDLQKISADTWKQKLDILCSESEPDHPLHQVKNTLHEWKQFADRIPVHDLLNYIFSSWNILDRYRATLSGSDAEHVCGRLNQFLQQSLDIESGRYSSITRFLRKIKEANPEALFISDSDKSNFVEIMTVHGAKGLEAPIVFIADSGPSTEPLEQFSVVTHWPAAADSPNAFMLGCKKSAMSQAAQKLKDEINQSSHEGLNLLYVAITRAKQILIMTGVNSKRSSNKGWIHQCMSALNIEEETEKQIWIEEHASKPTLDKIVSPETASIETGNDYSYLFKPINDSITNSIESEPTTNEVIEGTLIHKLLEIMTQAPEINDQALLNRVNLETNNHTTLEQLKPLKAEANNCLKSEALKEIFNSNEKTQTYHEVTVANTSGKHQINIIDLMLVSENEVRIIDFKTQANISETEAQNEATKFTAQLKRYADAVQPLYPSHSIRCSVVFTKITLLVDVPINDTSTN